MTRRGWSRRLVAEVCLVLVVGGLVTGVLIGTGLAKTVVRTPNPLTWLANLRGDVVQVHPDAGVQDKLKIGAPGDRLLVSQEGTRLVVHDETSGEVTVIDLATTTVSGRVQSGPGGRLKVLLGAEIYLVDLKTGLLLAVDPLTAGTVSTWRVGNAPLADAATNRDGAEVYILDSHGGLSTVGWSGRGFVLRGQRRVPGAGESAQLVGQDSGVAVVDGKSGTFAQYGTGGPDQVVTVPALHGPLVVPPNSPAALVPVAAPDSAAVVLLRADRTVTVPLGGYGCRPGPLVAFRDRVYVACPDAGKVLVLDRDGRAAQPPIRTPPGPVEFVLNAGMLFIHSPRQQSAVVVDPTGQLHPVRTDDATLPVRDPDAQPTAVPSPPRHTRGGTPEAGNTPRHRTLGPAPSPAPSPPPSPSPLPSPTQPSSTQVSPTQVSPTQVSPTPRQGSGCPPGAPVDPVLSPFGRPLATADPNGSVRIAWNKPPGVPDSPRLPGPLNGYEIRRSDTGQPVANTGPAATSAVITTLATGSTLELEVLAVYTNSSSGPPPCLVYASSGPSNTVTVIGLAGAPGNIRAQITARTPSTMTLSINFDVTSDGGSPPTSYDLTIDGPDIPNSPLRQMAVGIGSRPRSVDIACGSTATLCSKGGTINVTIAVNTAAGGGQPATQPIAIPAPTFALPGNLYLVGPGNQCLDVRGGDTTNKMPLVMDPCNDAASEHWMVSNEAVTVLQAPNDPLGTPKCADVRNESTARLAVVQIYNCKNIAGQRFAQLSRGYGAVSFRGSLTSWCLHVVNDSRSPGAGLEMSDCDGTVFTYFDRDQATVAQPTPAGPPRTGSPLNAGSPRAADPTAVLVPQSDSLGGSGTSTLLFFPVVLVAGRILRRRGVSAASRGTG
jgi:hypothetical protein